jgi:Nucleotide-diphospho-sugar transferase
MKLLIKQCKRAVFGHTTILRSFTDLRIQRIISMKGLNCSSPTYMRMMRERAKFWMLINSMKISFFWVDSDIVFTRNVEELLKRPDVQLSDLAFQLDSPVKLTHAQMIRRNHEGRLPTDWAEACGGFFFARGLECLTKVRKQPGIFFSGSIRR